MFKRSFLAAREMQEHIAAFRRAAPGSDIHTYAWMYNACKAVLAHERHEQVAAERIASHKPGASEPATPVVPDEQKEKNNAAAIAAEGKGKGKGKEVEVKGRSAKLTDEEFKKWASTKSCTRFVSKDGCKFGNNFYFKHDQELKGTEATTYDTGGVAIPFTAPGVVATFANSYVAEHGAECTMGA